jgi:putative component of membrane protein insertase Oxa1/YidC/SpoIIIJ protein YidD
LPLALFLIIKRVIRCYPGQWAYDPVPLPPLPRRSWKTKKIF